MKLLASLTFLNKSIYLLIFYIFAGTLLMNFSDDDALRGIRLAILGVVASVDSFKQKLVVLSDAREENEALYRENFYLQLTNQRLSEVLIENRRLKRMIALRDSIEHHPVAARVIGLSAEQGIRTLIINVGSQDSVQTNMPVVNADGLVGKIIETTPNQSHVQMLMDHNMFVSARLQNSREAGYVGWSGKDWLNLNHIPKNIPVVKGERVITSGLSRIYPPGLKIGFVTAVEENEHDLFKSVRLRPAVEFNRVEEVFVIRGPRQEALPGD